jgi:serpin B
MTKPLAHPSLVRSALAAILVSALSGCGILSVSPRGGNSQMRQFCEAGGGSRAADASVVQASNHFSLSLYNQIRLGSGNQLVSAYSIGSVLAMTHAGANGNTASQIAQALFLPDGGNAYDSASAALERQVVCGGILQGYTVDLANAAFVSPSAGVLSQYLQTLSEDYGAQAFDVDFSQDSALQQINQWTDQQTEGLIPTLFSSLDPGTRMVLANAVYFEAHWQSPFDPGSTYSQTFYADGTNAVSVPMMHQQSSFRYAPGGDYDALELPYTGSVYSMVIFLPHNRDAITGIEQEIAADTSQSWDSALTASEVQVALPKFQFAVKYDMMATLQALGIRDLFDSSADLSGIDGQHDLMVNQFVHKTYIQVDEQGTKAAAASGEAMISAANGSVDMQVFTADHPFLFLIRDNATKTQLFWGRLADPSAAQ